MPRKEKGMEKEYLDWRDNPTMRAWRPERLNARSEYTISEANNDLNKATKRTGRPFRARARGLLLAAIRSAAP